MNLDKYIFISLLALFVEGCSSSQTSSGININHMFVKENYNFDKEIKKLEDSFDKKMQHSLESDLDLITLSDNLESDALVKSPQLTSPVIPPAALPVELPIAPLDASPIAPLAPSEPQAMVLPIVESSPERLPATTSPAERKVSRLKYFIENGTIGMLRELLNHSKVDLNKRTPDGDTWLITAMRAGRIDNARELMAHGADLKTANAKGELPEHFEGFRELTKKLP